MHIYLYSINLFPCEHVCFVFIVVSAWHACLNTQDLFFCRLHCIKTQTYWKTVCVCAINHLEKNADFTPWKDIYLYTRNWTKTHASVLQKHWVLYTAQYGSCSSLATYMILYDTWYLVVWLGSLGLPGCYLQATWEKGNSHSPSSSYHDSVGNGYPPITTNVPCYKVILSLKLVCEEGYIADNLNIPQ